MQKFVRRIFSSETQRPSGVKLWQIPIPVVDPIPRPGAAWRFGAPLLAHEASYLAASASRASLRSNSILYLYTVSPRHARPAQG